MNFPNIDKSLGFNNKINMPKNSSVDNKLKLHKNKSVYDITTNSK